jgi:hypothetical protein
VIDAVTEENALPRFNQTKVTPRLVAHEGNHLRPSGDHDGTLMVALPAVDIGDGFGVPPSMDINRK